MTTLKIKENLSKAEPVDDDYPYENINGGDMFYCYDMDWLVMVVEDDNEEYYLIELSSGEVIPEEEDMRYFEDIFKHLTKVYGDWYPVSKAKLKFTVGE